MKQQREDDEDDDDGDGDAENGGLDVETQKSNVVVARFPVGIGVENVPLEVTGVPIRQGAVAEGIVNYADEEPVDLIVMVSGYRGRFGGLMGTITERVVRGATVPVTSFRTGQVRLP
ncbi:MAG: universal stress protein [Halalkalicoccus sp.]